MANSLDEHKPASSLCSAIERKQCINMAGHDGPHNWVTDTTVEVLTADVRWLMQEMANQSQVVYRIPEHLCGFEVAPETGHCEFHERWFDAAAHVGLLAEWATEDVEAAFEMPGPDDGPQPRFDAIGFLDGWTGRCFYLGKVTLCNHRHPTEAEAVSCSKGK